MENFTIRIEAQRLAEGLLAQARENELEITADLQKIAPEVDAKIIGLENRFKAEKSLARKLSLLADRDKSNQSVQHKLEKFARRNNDTLRYTFILSNDRYARDFYKTIETLKQNGFLIPQNRIWNAWENAETAKDTGYK